MPKSPRPPRLLLPLMLLSCVTLTGCAHGTDIAVTDPVAACAVWRPVIFSRLHDTEETIRQVKALNAAHDAYCGVVK